MTESRASAWRCTVCGYIHRGDAPPDVCPVCGAPAAEFEPYQPEPKAPAPRAVEHWRCLNCNHLHAGDEPPERCPVCGARADSFEPLAAAARGAAATAGAVRVVVLGAGIAGLSAVEALRAANPEARITLVSKESELPYYRLNLTRYLAGEIGREALPIHPERWYAEQGVELRREAEVAGFDPGGKQVRLHGGDRLAFDKLVLTIGAHAFVPPLPGAARECVTALRTVADADCILESTAHGERVACIGGGILGLETAAALARRGCAVTLIEGFDWLLPRQLNRRAGEILARHVTSLGIEPLLGVKPEEIVGDERARGVQLADGRSVEADLVVVTTGVRPNSYLARGAGLKVNQGVVVDDRLQSSHPDVLAAGDVAEHQGTVYGVWSPSLYQGRIAGMNAVGLRAEFGGIPRSNSLKVVGYDLFSIGRVAVEDGSYRVLEQEADGAFCRLVLRDGLLHGAVLLGDTAPSSAVKKAIEERADLSGVLGGRPSCAEVLEHLAQASA